MLATTSAQLRRPRLALTPSRSPAPPSVCGQCSSPAFLLASSRMFAPQVGSTEKLRLQTPSSRKRLPAVLARTSAAQFERCESLRGKPSGPAGNREFSAASLKISVRCDTDHAERNRILRGHGKEDVAIRGCCHNIACDASAR